MIIVYPLIVCFKSRVQIISGKSMEAATDSLQNAPPVSMVVLKKPTEMKQMGS